MAQSCVTTGPWLAVGAGRLILVLKKSIPGAILLLVYFSAAVLIHPFANLPFHDDWTYAWSVEHFLTTGELRVLEWSVHYPFAQILWGALFCLPFGFSFSALRVSTVVLAWLGALALYGTLRELGRGRGESLIATGVFIANPVFFVLGFSFMTDVPFVSLTNIVFFFVTRGLSRRSSRELYLGCLVAAVAFFVRQIAIAIPASLLVYFLFASSFRSWRYLLPAAGFCMVFFLAIIFTAQAFGVTQQSKFLTAWVADFWLHRPSQSVPGVLRIFVHTGLALLPLTLSLGISTYRRRLFWSSVVALVILTGCSVLIAGEPPNPQDGLWQLNALGRERLLLRGVPARDFLPSWFNLPLFTLALLSSAALITKTIDIARAGVANPKVIFVWYACIHFALMIALWFFGPWGSDRYAIVLLPPLIALLADSRSNTKIAFTGFSVLFVLSLLISWNETQTSRAIARALSWLRARNIPRASIDAGYVFNGWNLYAHPQNLTTGAVPQKDVPGVTSTENERYVIASSPLPSYRVLRTYGWSIPLRSTDYRIYVLEELAGGTNSAR